MLGNGTACIVSINGSVRSVLGCRGLTDFLEIIADSLGVDNEGEEKNNILDSARNLAKIPTNLVHIT